MRENLSDLFNSKDSFIWFALFAAFDKYGLEDERFADFLTAFKDSLHGQEIDGKTYDEVNETRATKDKRTMVEKLGLLEKLMADYLEVSNTAKCA